MAVSQFREGGDSAIGKFFYFFSWGIDATMVTISPSTEDRTEKNVGEVASEQTIPLILWISIPTCKPEPGKILGESMVANITPTLPSA